MEHVVLSYSRHDLVSRWNLIQRYSYHSNTAIRKAARKARCEPQYTEDLIRTLTIVRSAHWQEHRSLFDHMEVKYLELISDPIATLSMVMDFLGLHLHAFQERSIISHSNSTGRSPYTSFCGTNSSPLPTAFSRAAHEELSGLHLSDQERFGGYVCSKPVTVKMAAEFLNIHQSVDARDDYYLYCNPFNPDLPLKYWKERWRYSREDENRPITGFSALGALRCCQYFGGRLPKLSEMLFVAAAIGWPGEEEFPEACKAYMIAETSDGPVSMSIEGEPPVFVKLGYDVLSKVDLEFVYHLYGNVAEWCLPDDFRGEDEMLKIGSLPVFGAGWNKDETFLSRKFYSRWARTGAVSVGFRIAADFAQEHGRR